MKNDVAPPIFEERQGFLIVTFKVTIAAAEKIPKAPATGQVTGQVTEQLTGQVLRFCQKPRKAGEIQKLLGLRHRETFQNNYLKPLLDNNWLERIIPDKPRSRLQKYRLTQAGKEKLKKLAGNKPSTEKE